MPTTPAEYGEEFAFLLRIVIEDPSNRLTALECLTRLPLTTRQWVSISPAVIAIISGVAANPRCDACDANSLRVLARIPLRSVREALGRLAAQSGHIAQIVCARALAQQGDTGGFPALMTEFRRTGDAEIFQDVACLPVEALDLPAQSFEGELKADDSMVRLWAAIACARLGRFEPLEELWSVLTAETSPDGAADPGAWFSEPPPMFWGDPWTAYNALAHGRPVPEALRDRLVHLRNETLARHADRDPKLPRDAGLLFGGLTGLLDAEGNPIPADVPKTRHEVLGDALDPSATRNGQRLWTYLEALADRPKPPEGALHLVENELVQFVLELGRFDLDPLALISNAKLIQRLPRRILVWILARLGPRRVLKALAPSVLTMDGDSRGEALAWIRDALVDVSIGGGSGGETRERPVEAFDDRRDSVEYALPELGPKQTPPEPSHVQFQVRLEGPQVCNGAVIKKSDVDLILFLGAEDMAARAKIHSDKLQALLDSGGTLGVMVIPVGYSLRSGPCQQTISLGPKAQELELCFPLIAAGIADEDAGAWLYLDLDHIRIGSFFLPIPIVEDTMEAQARSYEQIIVDLDSVGQPLDAELYIDQKGEGLGFAYSIKEQGNQRCVLNGVFPRITRANLKTSLDGLNGKMSEVATCVLWRHTPDHFKGSLTDDEREMLQDQLLKIASVGWKLWTDLQADPQMKVVLDRINKLPSGSRISVITDWLFIPWEILYPENPKVVTVIKPELFWGARYILASTSFEPQKPGEERLAHAAGAPAAVICIDPSIDNDFNEVKPPAPAASHREWISQQAAKKFAARVIDDPSSVWDLLREGTKVEKWIYLFCHGRAAEGGATEALLLGGKTVIEPSDLKGTSRFRGRPIVFINSCSSGALNPLNLNNFYATFRDPKSALGILGTSFPVPTVLAAEIGKWISSLYLEGRHDLGSALFKVRSELLSLGIPIGLYYTLHAPGDARAVGDMPKRSNNDL